MLRSFCVNYCDDIRLEVGNKISLIGIYGSDLVVPETPTVVPKLCIYAQLYTEPGSRFDEDVELRVTVGDALITNAIHKANDLVVAPKGFQKAAFTFIMSPFLVERDSTLRVKAYYKGSEYSSATLKIKGQVNEESVEESESESAD